MRLVQITNDELKTGSIFQDTQTVASLNVINEGLVIGSSKHALVGLSVWPDLINGKCF